jgi:hypothetical protein
MTAVGVLGASPQFKQRLQKLRHRLARFLGGGGVAADMRVAFDAGDPVAERRLPASDLI